MAFKFFLVFFLFFSVGFLLGLLVIPLETACFPYESSWCACCRLTLVFARCTVNASLLTWVFLFLSDDNLYKCFPNFVRRQSHLDSLLRNRASWDPCLSHVHVEHIQVSTYGSKQVSRWCCRDADAPVQRPHPVHWPTQHKDTKQLFNTLRRREKVTICKCSELSHEIEITERMWIFCLKFKVKLSFSLIIIFFNWDNFHRTQVKTAKEGKAIG